MGVCDSGRFSGLPAAEGGASGQPFTAGIAIDPPTPPSARFNGLSFKTRDANLAF